MSCIVWNARGLGSPRTFRELRRLVTDRKPSLLFLCETRMAVDRCLKWKNYLNFERAFGVSSEGKSGGLLLFWQQPFDVTIKSYSKGHIDCVVLEGAKQWRFTGFYGNPNTSLRHHSWNLLRRLKNLQELSALPWIVGGDFNEVCFDTEKYGGRNKSFAQMTAFRDTLEECELRDMFCEGEFFTWMNKRNNENQIFECLDRFVSSDDWRSIFPTAKISSLEFYCSDHRPLELVLGSNPFLGCRIKKSKKYFRFENCWLGSTNLTLVVEEGWNSTDRSASLQDRIQKYGETLQAWAGSQFNNLSQKLKRKRKKLNQLKTHQNWEFATTEVRDLEQLIEKIATQEEQYWKKRSRNNWLKHGDINSKFFHAQASNRRSKNFIKGLVSNQGDFCSNWDGISTIVTEYFSNLFNSCNPYTNDLFHILECVEQRVDSDMNQFLSTPFTETEVKSVVFELGAEKTPGPDGMPGTCLRMLELDRLKFDI